MLFEVPAGWTRGEPIAFYGGGPRYRCSRNVKACPLSDFDPNVEISITFESEQETHDFRNWWYETSL